MIRNRPTPLLAIATGLVLALSSRCATAALIVGALPCPQYECTDDLLGSFAIQSLFSGDAAPAGASPAEEGAPPSIKNAERHSPPATACGSSSVSQSSGGGSSYAALAQTACDLPPAAPKASLPSEGKMTLPTGPPFELLRPPELALAS